MHIRELCYAKGGSAKTVLQKGRVRKI